MKYPVTGQSYSGPQRGIFCTFLGPLFYHRVVHHSGPPLYSAPPIHPNVHVGFDPGMIGKGVLVCCMTSSCKWPVVGTSICLTMFVLPVSALSLNTLFKTATPSWALFICTWWSVGSEVKIIHEVKLTLDWSTSRKLFCTGAMLLFPVIEWLFCITCG